LKISVLCSDESHPIFPLLRAWVARQREFHDVSLETKSRNLPGGDVLFLVSCHELIPPSLRAKYAKTLVLHASDLPRGRGWSPHVWAVLENQSHITVSLLEADDPPDTGAIWAKAGFDLEGHELYDEINAKLFDIELRLMDTAIRDFGHVKPLSQVELEASYYRRRVPEDSKIDTGQPIDKQFDLLRVCDPQRYPAYFEKNGHIYEIILRKRAPRT
jgi:methionyl-tRNA formyltransferase